MSRVQAIVVRGQSILMVKHSDGQQEWWCIPGGGLEECETPENGALRELREECKVNGLLIRQMSHQTSETGDATYSFLIDIGDQEPSLGHDPEVSGEKAKLVDVRWLTLREIPERDRTFLWAAGLVGVGDFFGLVESWGDAVSYPAELD